MKVTYTLGRQTECVPTLGLHCLTWVIAVPGRNPPHTRLPISGSLMNRRIFLMLLEILKTQKTEVSREARKEFSKYRSKGFSGKATLGDTSKAVHCGQVISQRLGRCSPGLCHSPLVWSGLDRVETQHPCGLGRGGYGSPQCLKSMSTVLALLPSYSEHLTEA